MLCYFLCSFINNHYKYIVKFTDNAVVCYLIQNHRNIIYNIQTNSLKLDFVIISSTPIFNFFYSQIFFIIYSYKLLFVSAHNGEKIHVS